VVEFISISTLTGFGVAGGAATAGVLCWRLVNFWLPIPFGGIAYLSLRLGRNHAHAHAHAHAHGETHAEMSHPSSGSNGGGTNGVAGTKSVADTEAMPPGLVN